MPLSTGDRAVLPVALPAPEGGSGGTVPGTGWAVHGAPVPLVGGGAGSMSDTHGRQGGELWSAFCRTGLGRREVWLRYLSLGGNADEVWVEGQLSGVLQLPPGEHNVLAHVVNEALDDLPSAERGPKVAFRPLREDVHRRR